MDLTEKLIWAELRYKVLESAVMVNDQYSNEEVLTKLLEILDLIDNTQR